MKRKQNNPKGRNPPNGNKNINRNQSLIMKEPGMFVPKSVVVELVFPDSQVIRTGGGASNSTNWSYQATSAYDPDPSFGTGAMPGFNEWAVFFQRYRVKAFRLLGTIAALDATPVAITATPSLTFFGNNTRTNTQIMEYGTNPLSVSKVISGVNGGSNSFTFDNKWSLTQIIGNNRWKQDPNFSALITTNPVIMCSLMIGAYNLNTGVNWLLGLGTALRLSMTVEFLDRRLLTT